MIESKDIMDQTWSDPDDAPDLSTPEWQEKMKEADLYQGETLIRRGRPRLERPKKLVTLRLDQDVVERWRGSGPGWQSRINELLKTAVGL